MSEKIMKRPKSEDLADLHVFVVPIESWLGKYSVAYNSVALQSTSAGFIRVFQHATLINIRNIIAEQLESSVVPNEYVFLRSVGRCMAVVNKNQEKNMKAKHFLPPVAYSPEIFILPGTHEWIASLRDKTKSIVVNKDHLIQDESAPYHGSGFSQSNLEGMPYYEKFSQQNSSSGVWDDSDDYYQDKERNEEVANMEANEKGIEAAPTKEHYSPRMDEFKQDTTESSDSSEMLSEESLNKIMKRSKSQNSSQESNRHVASSMNENEASHDKAENSNSNNDNNSNNRLLENGKKAEMKSPKSTPTIQVIHPHILSQPVQNGRLTTPTPIPSANVIHSTLKYSSYDRNYIDKDQSTRDSNASPRDRSRRKDEERNSYDDDYNDQSKSNTDDSLVVSEPSSEQDEDKDDVTKVESSTENDTSEENIKSNGEELSPNNRYEMRSKSRARSLKEELKRNAEKRLLEEEKMRLEDKKKNMENETLELMKGMEELLQKKKEEEIKRRKEEEERKRKEKEEIDRQKHEVTKLREELLRVKKYRAEKQKEREGLLRKAKELKANVDMKKSKDNNIWKRKYEEAKERTGILEEELNRVKEELGAQQKKLLQGIDGKGTGSVDEEKSSSKMANGPSALNNLRNEARRSVNEIEGLKRDTEKTKKFLRIESKKKTEAQKELKELREQMNEKRKVITVKKTEGNQRDLQINS